VIECKSYRRYKGLRKPRCNDGKGCKKCNEKYRQAKGK